MKNWGLVLSGGTAFGLAHAGLIEELEAEGLTPDCVAGSSMGAIVGALYASGHGPAIMRDLCEKLTLTSVATWSKEPLKGGLHGGLLSQRIREHLEPLLGEKTIGDCSIPFVCVAGRVKKPINWLHLGKGDFLERVRASVELHVFPPPTPLIDAILASSAVPIVFSPAKIGNDEFVDLLNFGAILARTLRERCHPDVVIACDATEERDTLAKFLPKGGKDFIRASADSLEKSRQACDLILRPDFPAGQSWRLDKAMQFYESGRAAAQKELPALKKLLKK
jgi:NTE family protein